MARHQQDFQPIQNKGLSKLFFHHHAQPLPSEANNNVLEEGGYVNIEPLLLFSFHTNPKPYNIIKTKCIRG
jgi:hypothetical protein